MLDDKAISVHAGTVKVPFLVNHLFSLADALDTTTASLGLSEEIEKQESGDGEDDIEDIWMRATYVIAVNAVHQHWSA